MSNSGSAMSEQIELHSILEESSRDDDYEEQDMDIR